jgi:hypothetical protein
MFCAAPQAPEKAVKKNKAVAIVYLRPRISLSFAHIMMVAAVSQFMLHDVRRATDLCM